MSLVPRKTELKELINILKDFEKEYGNLEVIHLEKYSSYPFVVEDKKLYLGSYDVDKMDKDPVLMVGQ